MKNNENLSDARWSKKGFITFLFDRSSPFGITLFISGLVINETFSYLFYEKPFSLYTSHGYWGILVYLSFLVGSWACIYDYFAEENRYKKIVTVIVVFSYLIVLAVFLFFENRAYIGLLGLICIGWLKVSATK